MKSTTCKVPLFPHGERMVVGSSNVTPQDLYPLVSSRSTPLILPLASPLVSSQPLWSYPWSSPGHLLVIGAFSCWGRGGGAAGGGHSVPGCDCLPGGRSGSACPALGTLKYTKYEKKVQLKRNIWN